MNVTEFLKSTFDPSNPYLVRPRICCKDGFSISVQGGTEYHYCTPRKHCNQYIEVELGFPSAADPLLEDYAEDPSDPTGTVYGYVPIEVVENLVEKHGGMIE